MYYKMVHMLAAIWLLIKSESSIRITKALAHRHQKPRTSSICEDVFVAKRGPIRNQKLKNEKKKKWNYWQKLCEFHIAI